MVEPSSEVGGEIQPQVFVSYARHDAPEVLTITRLLEENGVSVWRDEERILGGQYYGEAIVHAIAHSRVVLLMCSPYAFQSDNVHTEVLLTWDHYHRRYMPVWLSPPTQIPERFRYCLARCQWIDAHSLPPERWLPQLLKALEVVGVETKNSGVRSGGATSRISDRPGENTRPGLRFRAGDKPIRGADWELELLLGKGGFGEVWRARNPHLQSVPPVALKFCLELDDRAKDLLRHEADMVLRAQQQIRSTGIVPLLHAYLSNDPPCLEYPYIEGGTLVRLLDECRETGTPLTPVHVQRIVEQVARIISPVHRATPRLVHRDLKPSNILVERRGDRKIVLRVTDFGIGGLAAQPVLERSRSSSSQMGNMASVLTGSYSPLYASPQQVRGDKPDPRDDVYALGVIWYQLLAGDLTRPAPTGRRWIEDLRGRGMSDEAIDLLSSCFETAPSHRPDDAGALCEQLQAIAAATTTRPAGSATELPQFPVSSPPPLQPPRGPGIATVSTEATAPKPAPAQAAMAVQETLREVASGLFTRFGLSGPLRRWAAAGTLGLAGLLGVILYVNTGADPDHITTLTGQIKLRRIPAGTFLMGSPDDDQTAKISEKPRHSVRITRPFYLGVHEVTRGQFRQFVDDSGYQTEAEKDPEGGWGWNEQAQKYEQNPRYSWLNPGFEQTDAHPVVNVSWNDAMAFVEWLSGKERKTYRLPTEAEWEYACRAGSTTEFCFGDNPEGLAEVGNVADATARARRPDLKGAIAARDGSVYTAPVGRYRPNAWGLYDMHGNVWEWCSDWFSSSFYRSSPVDDPAGPLRGGVRVFRGGSWGDDSRDCRSSNRSGGPPGGRGSSAVGLGFRLVLVNYN